MERSARTRGSSPRERYPQTLQARYKTGHCVWVRLIHPCRNTNINGHQTCLQTFFQTKCTLPRSKKDLTELRRQQQPYISMTSGNYVLLAQKDLQADSISSKASQKLGPIKRKERISTLPKLDTKDEFGLNERSFVTTYEGESSIRGLKPDFI